MSRKSIRVDVLAQVVGDKGRVFATKDISEDPRFRRAHPELVDHGHFHAFVGGALSDHRVDLGIVEIRKSTSRGSLWEKQGAVAGQAVEKQTAGKAGVGPAVVPSTADEGLGPQSAGDASFTARMRRHQSWYRWRVLGLAYGTGPTPSSTSRYGNMLTPEDGAAGRNFLTTEIAQVARDRVAQGRGTVEPFRLFHNMLSSQPMCFNLFGPLVKDRELAKSLVATMVPEQVAEVTRVAIEWAPEPVEEFLGDRTAFDAFIEYETQSGQRCALGIETKLTEPFSQKEYDGDRYRRWMRVLDTPWRPEADATVHAISHNQLWRDHLLAIALRNHPRSHFAVSRLMVVYHPDDHDCGRVLSGYRRLLREGDDSLLEMPLDRLVGAWKKVVGNQHSEWLNAVSMRYLELERSNG